MILSKSLEEKVRRHFLASLFRKGDLKLHELYHKAVIKYNLYKKIVNLFIFDYLPLKAYDILGKMRNYSADRYHKTLDQYRGKRVFKENRSVSFFLEQLSDTKPKAEGKFRN